MKFNKRNLNIILLPVFSTLFVGSSLISSSCSQSIPESNDQLLTKNKVEKNFKTIWKDKTFLDGNDLSNYKEIQLDSFDSLEKELEYIDISDIRIISSTSYSIKWPKVKEIKVNNSNNVKIVNNLLCFKGISTWWVNTIANRNLKLDVLKFPTSLEMYENSTSKYAITDNFYDFNIFKNINKISFNDSDFETPIYEFGANSFNNCDKLDDNLIFNFKEQYNFQKNNNFINYIKYGSNSFLNTNVSNVQINLENSFDFSAFDYDEEWQKKILFNIDSFANNKNLSSFILEDGGIEKASEISFDLDVFNNCEKLKNFKISAKKIKIKDGIFSDSNNLFKGSNNLENIEFIAEEANFSTNNIFSNDYESLNLSLLIDNGLYTKSSTFSGINIPNYKLNIVTYNKMSLYNSGLTNEQFYNAKQIPYTSKVLNKKMVKQNLASIWKDKNYLSTNDLNEFTHIKSDAFDDINTNLEYIDISNLELISNTNSIKWKNVSEIRTSNSNNKKIINNILFTNFNNQWFANTLANKKLKINELKFPPALDVTGKNQNKYSISNYFYDSEAFKNVNKISFNDTNYEIGMSWFGIESFASCNILDEEINFNYLEDIDNKYGNFVLFRNNSFYNTNIKRLNISISSSNLKLDSYSFSNNKNLNDFNISCSNDVDSWFYLCDYLLSDCNNLTSFNLTSNNLLLSSYLFKGANKLNFININANKLGGLSEFVFANDYDSFNLKLLFKVSYGDFDSNSFSNINVNIEKFNMEVFNNPSIQYLGLTEEQKNKIIYI